MNVVYICTCIYMYLLFVIVFESIFVAFFQSTEGQVDLRGPPYLSPSQRHLCTCVYMELMFVYLNNEGGKERGREGEGGREGGRERERQEYLCWWIKHPLFSRLLLIGNNGLHEFMSDGGLHGLQQ